MKGAIYRGRKPVKILISEEVLKYRRKYPPIETADPDKLFVACLKCNSLGNPATGFSGGKILIACKAQNNRPVTVRTDIVCPTECEHAKSVGII